MPITHATTDTFDELTSTGRAIAYFWAEWCGPCRTLAPNVAQVADTDPTVQIAKVDIEAEPALAADNQILSIPTLVFFKDGVEAARIVGTRSADQLRAEIARIYS